MRITVKYAAQVKLAAGIASEHIDVDSPCSLPQFVLRIADSHGPTLKKLLLDAEGRVHRSILIFVGDDQVRNGDPVKLKDGDVVTILSPVSGG